MRDWLRFLIPSIGRMCIHRGLWLILIVKFYLDVKTFIIVCMTLAGLCFNSLKVQCHRISIFLRYRSWSFKLNERRRLQHQLSILACNMQVGAWDFKAKNWNKIISQHKFCGSFKPTTLEFRGERSRIKKYRLIRGGVGETAFAKYQQKVSTNSKVCRHDDMDCNL